MPPNLNLLEAEIGITRDTQHKIGTPHNLLQTISEIICE